LIDDFGQTWRWSAALIGRIVTPFFLSPPPPHTTHRDQFHTPRNLALALVGEVGELCECFQWKGEVAEGLPGFSAKERAHVGQELSDVLLYLLRLADKCAVDLPAVCLDKISLNALKYPSKMVRGSSKKYSEY